MVKHEEMGGVPKGWLSLKVMDGLSFRFSSVWGLKGLFNV